MITEKRQYITKKAHLGSPVTWYGIFTLHWSKAAFHLLHPAQIHAFSQQRGMRAKTDRLDAITIARALLSDELRIGYVPSEEVATYRELVRLQHQLTEDVVRYKKDIYANIVLPPGEVNISLIAEILPVLRNQGMEFEANRYERGSEFMKRKRKNVACSLKRR